MPKSWIWIQIQCTRIWIHNSALRFASHRGVNLHGVMHTVKSDSAMCITPWSPGFQILRKTAVCIPPRIRSPRCASHSLFNLHCVHFTASQTLVCIILQSQLSKFFRSQEHTIAQNLHGMHHSKVCITLPSQSPQCASYCGDDFCSLHHTSESRAPNFEKLKLPSVHAKR